MFLRKTLLFAACVACAGPALAVDFGVMETADAVYPGQFKFMAFPIGVRQPARREQESGLAMGVGYGLLDRVDLEVQGAVYDNISYFGSDVEYTWLEGHPWEASLSGGAHYARSDFGDPWGLDLTQIVTYALPVHAPLRLNAALDLGYEEAGPRYARALDVDQRYWTAYVTPGLQYRFSQNLDMIGEVGVGMNAASSDYVAVGLSYYFARPGTQHAAAKGKAPERRAAL